MKNLPVDEVENIAEKRALSAEIESLSASIQLIKYHHNKLTEELQSKLNRLQTELLDMVEKL